MTTVAMFNCRSNNLSEHTGEEFEYITQNSQGTGSATCQAIADWTTVFDPEVGYDEYMTSFYVPEGILPENVQFSGSAPMFEKIDGYEWRCIRLVVTSTTSFYSVYGFEDYYSLQQYDEGENIVSVNKNDNSGSIGYGTFSLEYEGKEFSNCFLYIDLTITKEENTYIQICNVFYRIPCGYDGCILSLQDTRNATEQIVGHMDSGDVKRGAGDYYFRMK